VGGRPGPLPQSRPPPDSGCPAIPPANWLLLTRAGVGLRQQRNQILGGGGRGLQSGVPALASTVELRFLGRGTGNLRQLPASLVDHNQK